MYIYILYIILKLRRDGFAERQQPFEPPSDWKALWYSNLEELQRANEANENNTITNVTVQLGGTAYLHCKVRSLAERSVADAEVSLHYPPLVIDCSR